MSHYSQRLRREKYSPEPVATATQPRARGYSHSIHSVQSRMPLLAMKFEEGSAYLLDIIIQRLTQRLLVVVVAGHICVN